MSWSGVLFSKIKALIGNLGDLTTDDTSNLVAAINELKAAIGDLDDLDTTAKDNLVAAINEVLAGATGFTVTQVQGYQDVAIGDFGVGVVLEIAWDHDAAADDVIGSPVTFGAVTHERIYGVVNGSSYAYAEAGIRAYPVSQISTGDYSGVTQGCFLAENISADGSD